MQVPLQYGNLQCHIAAGYFRGGHQLPSFLRGNFFTNCHGLLGAPIEKLYILKAKFLQIEFNSVNLQNFLPQK